MLGDQWLMCTASIRHLLRCHFCSPFIPLCLLVQQLILLCQPGLQALAISLAFPRCSSQLPHSCFQLAVSA